MVREVFPMLPTQYPTSLFLKSKRRQMSITVPGALGGVVETTTIWLTFIQIIERMIVNFPATPVYDCTEGGALIEGTIVTPLAEYIEEKIRVPECVVSRWGGSRRKRRFGAIFSERFSGAFSRLDRLEEKTAGDAKKRSKCTAPALLPERRQALAFQYGWHT